MVILDQDPSLLGCVRNLKKIILSVVVLVLFTGTMMPEAEVDGGRFLSDMNSDLFNKGILQLDNGQLAEAAETFNQLIQLKTLSFWPYFFPLNIFQKSIKIPGIG